MDRFIGAARFRKYHRRSTLKSNMDRFIVYSFLNFAPPTTTLKSNMDRFIEQVQKSF